MVNEEWYVRSLQIARARSASGIDAGTVVEDLAARLPFGQICWSNGSEASPVRRTARCEDVLATALSGNTRIMRALKITDKNSCVGLLTGEHLGMRHEDVGREQPTRVQPGVLLCDGRCGQIIMICPTILRHK
jgi:hypothetical protein